MKAIIIAPMVNANAVLPPMDGDGLHLTYLVDGVRTGGFTLVGNVPGPAPINTCFVLVHTSPETVDAMVASGDYLFVEALPVEEKPIAAMRTIKWAVNRVAEILSIKAVEDKHQLPDRAAVVQWLRNHGYSPALLNAKIPPGAPAHGVRRGLQDLHEVSEDEYGRAWH